MTALVQVKIDKKLKEQAEQLLNDFGLDITTALRMFLKAVVREQRVPLKLKKPKQDPLYSPENVAEIKRAAKELDEGKGITMTYEQLLQLTDAMDKATPDEVKIISEKVLKGEYFNA